MSVRSIECRVFVSERSRLGEGPVWFEDRLWWVDIPAGKLCVVDARGAELQTYDLGRQLGAAVPASGGRFIVAVADGIGFYEPGIGGVEVVVSPEGAELGNRFNDGKCDPRGRFLAGTLNLSGEKGRGALYSYTEGERTQKLVEGVSVSNGLAWSADGRTLYYIDTPTCEIAAFDYDLETGGVSNRRVAVTVPEGAGWPDGMTIDVEGNLWVAHWGGGVVRCWSPKNGEYLAEVRVPCTCPTSCCFGGPDLGTLFITSAGPEFAGGDDEPGSLAGGVFACEPGVAGHPVRPFSPPVTG